MPPIFNRIKNGFFAYFICFTEYRALIVFTLLRAAVILILGLFVYWQFERLIASLGMLIISLFYDLSSAPFFMAITLVALITSIFVLFFNYFISIGTARYMHLRFEGTRPSAIASVIFAFTRLRAWLFLIFSTVVLGLCIAMGTFIPQLAPQVTLLSYLATLPWIVCAALLFFVTAVIGVRAISSLATLKDAFHCLKNYWAETVGFMLSSGLTALILRIALHVITMFITNHTIGMFLSIIALLPAITLFAAKDIFKAAVVCAANNQPCGPFGKYLSHAPKFSRNEA